MSVAYNAAIAALHELGRALDRVSSVYAQAAKLDAIGYELKYTALAAMLATFSREERTAADNLSARMKLNMRQLTKAAANDR